MTGKRLKMVRESFGFSQAAFGKIFDIAQTTYAKYELGGAVPEKVMEYLAGRGISLNWLVTGQGSMYLDGTGEAALPVAKEDENTIMVPMTNMKVSAGFGENWDDQENFTGEMIPVPRKIATRLINNFPLVGAAVRGDSMHPTLRDGELVVYAHGYNGGDGIYVLAIHGELLVKRLQFDLFDQKVTVISDNDKYEKKVLSADNENLNILGKVVFWIHEEI